MQTILFDETYYFIEIIGICNALFEPWLYDHNRKLLCDRSAAWQFIKLWFKIAVKKSSNFIFIDYDIHQTSKITAINSALINFLDKDIGMYCQTFLIDFRAIDESLRLLIFASP